ncbi:dTDP-4-dehydrorhamnose 3,5-epimerase [Pseudomonas cedrina]|nr:dTDP-4-dehydrorhamnose 3,5-epimerase [Pseudomonas cedrina]
MKLIQASIPDVVIIEPKVFSDDRGWFFESFNEAVFHDALKARGLPVPRAFVQDNHSCSKKGVIRGLHYQLPPHAQGKLVRVTRGSAYDVVVDIRAESPTFGQWTGVELSAVNQRMLWIPEGFAHGFIALEDETHFLYKTTDVYDQASERSIRWDDPAIGITWPELPGSLVSAKDAAAPLLADASRYSEFLLGAKELIDLRVIGDERGSLIALEQGQNIPFAIKRAYYIFGTQPDVSRGFHAHRRLEQMAICVSGSCKMIIDDGETRETVLLDSSTKALIIRNMLWREMHEFSPDCVLLVFASEHFNESDYIRSYDQFIREVKNGKA